MKKTVYKWIYFLVFMAFLLPVFFTLIVFFLPAQYDETYLGAFAEKEERLESVQGEKLIIVGGSSVAFGIRSDLMEEQLGMPVVNWGLYAPLGSRTMLEACFDQINEGDIVIFCPEQNPETLSFSFQAEEMWQAMDGSGFNPEIFTESELKQLLGAFPGFAVSKLKYMIEGKPQGSGIYRRISFNEYGDIESQERERNQMTEGYDAAQLIDFSFFPEEDFVQYLNDYAARVKQKGAHFYYRFCPMNESAVVNEEKIDEWFLRLDDQTEFEILGDPHQSVMESGWFFDTNFHLNSPGAVVNTYYFVRDIKAQLKDSSVTDIVLPEMPEPAVQTVTGDNSDESCFIYAMKDDGVIITGVTQEGKMRETLTFPQEHGGKKITAVQAGSLKECENLSTVYVYGGITLYDGCFSGCNTLQKIILLGNPSEITAGRDLLRGTDAFLYAEDEDSYRLDYSWAQYSDKIKKYNHD